MNNNKTLLRCYSRGIFEAKWGIELIKIHYFINPQGRKKNGIGDDEKQTFELDLLRGIRMVAISKVFAKPTTFYLLPPHTLVDVGLCCVLIIWKNTVRANP